METAEATRGNTLVVRFPRRLLVVVPLLGLVGAAYLAYGLLHGGHFPLADGRFVVLAAALVAAAIGVLFMAASRIEIDAEQIAQYRGARLVRRASNRTIREICLGLQKKVLRFEGGEKFILHDRFENAATAAAFFRAMLDARAAGRADSEQAAIAVFGARPPAVIPIDVGGESPAAPAVGKNVTLLLAYVSFPARCCGCGRPPTAACPVTAMRSVFLLFVTLQTTATVFVPACNWCKMKRRVAGVLSLLFLMLTIMGGIGAIALLAFHEPALLLLLVPFLVSTWFLGKSLDGVLDRRCFGLRAVTMSRNVQTITLRFRDAGLAATVAALTERRRKERVQAAGRLLRDPGNG
jgi:hypothetical protein